MRHLFTHTLKELPGQAGKVFPLFDWPI